MVEGHQPQSLTTLSASMPGKSRRCSWRRAGAQPPARPASRWAGLGAAIGVHLLTCHHLLAKMVKTPHPAQARWGELNLFPTGFKTADTAQSAQREAPHKGSNQLGLTGHLISSHGGGLPLLLTRKGPLNKSRERLRDKKESYKHPNFFFFFVRKKSIRLTWILILSKLSHSGIFGDHLVMWKRCKDVGAGPH